VKTATEAHKNDEVRGGFAELPPFTTGVAKLLRVETYNDEGVLKFRAIGAMVAPYYAEGGVPLSGLETAQFVSVTEGDYDRNISDILDTIRKLVGQEKLDTLLRSYPNPVFGYDYDKICAAVTSLTKADPIFFRCSNKFEENKSGRSDPKTGKPYPGRTWQKWQLAVPGYTPPTAPQSAAPTTKPSTNGKKESDPAPWSNRKSSPPADQNPPESYSLTGEGDPTDWDQQVQLASDDHQSAKDTLTRAAEGLGYSTEEVDDAKSWAEVGEWVKSGVHKDGSNSVSTMEGGGTSVPTVGNTVKFLPQDAKYPSDPTRRNKRAVDCAISKIGANRTMVIQSLQNPDREWTVEWDSPYVEYPKAK
jgi:hypothetical protein